MSIQLSEVKPGDKLVALHGFDCLEAGQVYEVFQHEGSSELCVRCSMGAHHLKGQEDVHGDLVGFVRYQEPVPQREIF